MSVHLNTHLKPASWSYKKAASWNLDAHGNTDPLRADNQWHYKCINLNDQLISECVSAEASGTRPPPYCTNTAAGVRFVNSVIWHAPVYPAGAPGLDIFFSTNAFPFNPNLRNKLGSCGPAYPGPRPGPYAAQIRFKRRRPKLKFSSSNHSS